MLPLPGPLGSVCKPAKELIARDSLSWPTEAQKCSAVGEAGAWLL